MYLSKNWFSCVFHLIKQLLFKKKNNNNNPLNKPVKWQ